jgi:hypothetical protein
MKLRLEGSKIVADLSDENVACVISAEVTLRYADGKILPVVAFAEPPKEATPQVVASVQRRVANLLGQVHILPWGKRAFPIAVGAHEHEDSEVPDGKVGHVRKLPRLRRI